MVEAQPSPDGGFELLAVVQVSLIDDGNEIRLHDQDGALLQFEAMPYPFPADEEQEQQSVH